MSLLQGQSERKKERMRERKKDSERKKERVGRKGQDPNGSPGKSCPHIFCFDR